MDSFASVFFDIYDRKINSGEIAFKNMKMPMNDFNQLCIVKGYEPAPEVIETLCVTMKLNEEEQALFRSFIPPEL